jgi:hypothetical protein
MNSIGLIACLLFEEANHQESGTRSGSKAGIMPWININVIVAFEGGGDV